MAKIYVHGSKFHLDDLLCAAMGSLLGYTPIRTVDNEICSHVAPEDLVCDIGRQYDGVRFFDHHQPSTPLSQQVGLLWAAKGKDVIRKVDPRVPQECIQECSNIVDKCLIAPSDKIDTSGDEDIPPGVCTLSSVISFANPIPQDPDASNEAFFEQLEFVKKILKNYIVRTLKSIYGRKLIENAPIIDEKIVVLEKYTPWAQAVNLNHKFDGCLYCVYPSGRGGWNAQCIPRPKGMGRYKRFPIDWIGNQTSAETAEAMGYKKDYSPGDTWFCHQDRWIIGVPTKEHAIDACRRAIVARG